MSVSGLSDEHAQIAINMTLQAAVLGYHHAPAVHYTQAAKRWEGIEKDKKAWRGEFPSYADCSAYVTWCLWNGLDHFHYPDIVNHEHWKAGYTGTLMLHGATVRGNPHPADAVVYGKGWPGEHVAIYTGGGLVVSHGSEGGPYLLPLRYRPDVLTIRRFI